MSLSKLLHKTRLKLHVHEVWFLCLFLATALSAQVPQSDPAALLREDARQRKVWAAEWINSGDPLRVAWGSWLARVNHQTDLIPQLMRQVMTYEDRGDPDRRDSLLAVLDALIELRADVPVEEAARLYPQFAAQSVILLVRSEGNADGALLDIFEHAGNNGAWLAAGNVLIRRSAAGFAALLLDRLTQHLTISVFDPGSGGGSGGGLIGECGFAQRAPKIGWPPVGLYRLTQHPDRIPWLTPAFLVGGETPVYYWRVESGYYDNSADVPDFCSHGDRDRYRAQYLRKLTPLSDLDPYQAVTIAWNGQEDYLQRVASAIVEERARFTRVVRGLQEIGKVTPQEVAALRPRLEVMVVDQRHEPSAPLPSVLVGDLGVESRVQFSKPLL